MHRSTLDVNDLAVVTAYADSRGISTDEEVQAALLDDMTNKKMYASFWVSPHFFFVVVAWCRRLHHRLDSIALAYLVVCICVHVFGGGGFECG